MLIICFFLFINKVSSIRHGMTPRIADREEIINNANVETATVRKHFSDGYFISIDVTPTIHLTMHPVYDLCIGMYACRYGVQLQLIKFNYHPHELLTTKEQLNARHNQCS